MRAAAFCPGHITGFFFPSDNREPVRAGSRGAGICIDRGATSAVEISKGTGKVAVTINGQASDAPVTKAAVAALMGMRWLDVKVDTVLDLPAGEGFGMSAAGALSATAALAELLDMPIEDAFMAAHVAEIERHSGLGDVAALSKGGVTFRVKEGVPPFGEVMRIADDISIVACVVGPAVSTSAVLQDKVKKKALEQAGLDCWGELYRDPTLDNFLRLSREFTVRSGIASDKVMEALQALDGLGPSSMIMLGNAVFATGDLDEEERVLRRFGPVYRLSSDTQGPRVLSVE